MTVEYPATFRSMQTAMRCLVVLAMPGLSFGLLAQLKPIQLCGGSLNLLTTYAPFRPPCAPDLGYAYWLVPTIALAVIFWGVSSALHPGRPATP
jgi:hypothetical protein